MDEFNPSTSTLSGENERTLFPPLMTALDTYLDSDSNEKLYDIITEVKAEKKKKVKKKKVTKKNSPRPPEKLPETFKDLTSPKKGKIKLMPTQDYEEFNIRINNNDLSESAPASLKYPTSPARPASTTGPRPLSTPRGGRYYKQLDHSSIDSQTFGSQVYFPLLNYCPYINVRLCDFL
jgi:hypothetical protein